MRQCPRCGNDLHIVPVRNAISRLDNETRICSNCGQEEGMFELYFPGQPLPPINERIVANKR